MESSSVTNSLFKDISAAAVTVGDWRHNVQRDNMEMCENNTVSGNIIRRTSQEFYGSPAISAYYVQGLDIKNNDIKDIPYTGISLGWGWGENVEACRNNSVTGNRIENVLTTLKDGAHIYTMGPMRDSVISRNHLIRSIGDSRGGLYTDQGSGYLTLSENVVEKSKIWMYIWTDSIHDLMIKDNFSDTDNMLDQGVDNTFLNNTVVTNGNWPDKAKEVMTQAGTGRDTRRYELPAWRKGLTEQFAKTMFVSRDGATVEAEDYRGSYKTDGGKVSVYPVIVGKAIGDTVAGDRLSYEVTVPKDQTYEVLLNLSNGFDASQPQPRVKITVDGVVVADGVKIDNTGTWINYQEVNVGSTALSMGLHKIEVTFIDNGFSFDYLKLSSATGGGSDVDYDECAVTKQEDILAFADIEGHWARESILSLTEAGLLKGTDQTHFSPDDALTEKQAMILNTRMLGLEESVSGTDQPISRESFAVLLMKGYYQANGKYPITYDENVFLDFKNISPACLFSVLAARELGLMTGDVDGRFLPNETLTRAEASMVYERLKSLLGRGV
ncbi:MAG: S-layer homology domain-containing protein [Anaerovorax sp.]